LVLRKKKRRGEGGENRFSNKRIQKGGQGKVGGQTSCVCIHAVIIGGRLKERGGGIFFKGGEKKRSQGLS